MPTLRGSKSHSLNLLFGVLFAFRTGNFSAGSSRPHSFCHWRYLQSYCWNLSTQGIDCKWKQDWAPNFCLYLDIFMKTIHVPLFSPKLFEPIPKDKHDDCHPLLHMDITRIRPEVVKINLRGEKKKRERERLWCPGTC